MDSVPLLDGILVVDLAGEPGEMAGRILADLGARVVAIGPEPASLRSQAWQARKERRSPEELDGLLAAADVVIDTPLFPGAIRVDPDKAPRAVWVSVTPFGLEGPRPGWRAGTPAVRPAAATRTPPADPARPPGRCSGPRPTPTAGPERPS